MSSDRTGVIGVDVGGTNIRAGVVEIVSGRLGVHVVASKKIPAPRVPPPAFYDTIAHLIRDVKQQAERAGFLILPVVAIAQPGRFLPPHGTLARGTAPNLGTAPDQFDGLAPAKELERRLFLKVIAENDAVAQMRFGLDALLCDPTTRGPLLGEIVVYLGPGTGMGGGVARVSEAGDVEVLTDGHLFDLQVSAWADGTLTAEELFTGPAIAQRVAEANKQLTPPIHPARAGQLDVIMLHKDSPAPHRVIASQIADLIGDILAAIIATMHAGRIMKVRLETTADGRVLRHLNEPDRAWSAQDQALVRGTKRFILGGFVGCSRGLGTRVRDRALEVLRQRGFHDMQIMPIPVDSDDTGLLGVVRAIPLSELHQE